MPDNNLKADLNWGDDRRIFPRLTAWLQSCLQITWLRHIEPASVCLAFFPPLLVINFPLFWRQSQKLWDAAIPVVPALHFRVGWRRDMNTGEFYPSAALKMEERTKLW